MKKTTSFLLVLITILVCISSCSTENNESIDENKPIKYVFLYSSGEGSASQITNFLSATDYGIGNSARSEDKVYDELKNKEKTPFDGVGTFVYDRSECSYTISNSQKVYGDFYGTYDRYVNEESGDHVEYLHGTDILTTYFKGHVERPRGSTIDEITAKQVAEDFILKIITKKEFSKFDDGVFSPYAGSGLYACRYTRYIEGYATDEDIIVVIHPETEEVTSYSAHCFDKYDALEAKLTKEKLDAANEKLRTKIEEMNLKNLSMGISRIVTTISGEAFLRIPIDYDTSSGERTSEYVYINIL